MHKKLPEKGEIKGTVTIRRYRAGTLALIEPLAKEHRMYARLREHSSSPTMKAVYARHMRRLNDRIKKVLAARTLGRPVVNRNIIVWSASCGYDIFVQFLLSAYNGGFAFASTLGIAWGEIGTGLTAPANTDIALTTPVARATVSYAADSAFSIAQLQFFFPDTTLINQTYTEFGTFVGGTSTIGTGNMFNHALFTNPYSKSAGTDTTVEVDFAFGADSGFDDSGFS